MASQGLDADRSFIVAVRVRPPNDQEQLFNKDVCWLSRASDRGREEMRRPRLTLIYEWREEWIGAPD